MKLNKNGGPRHPDKSDGLCALFTVSGSANIILELSEGLTAV